MAHLKTWQDCYKKERKTKTLAELYAERERIKRDIKNTDKRTRNGKMSVIFARAELFALNELIGEREEQERLAERWKENG